MEQNNNSKNNDSKNNEIENGLYKVILSNKIFELENIPLILENNASQMVYCHLKSIAPNKGQRKLWAAKVRFLLWVREQIGDCKARIIYVGSAPGVSIPYVDKVIKGTEWITKWILWDPVNFHKELINSNRYECHQEFFTNETAYLYKNTNNEITIYIDDIRLAPPENMDRKTKEFSIMSDKLVWENIQSTIEWLRIIRPNFWMTKYRTPYQPVEINKVKIDSMQYPQGVIYFECWNGGGSTETRKWGTLDDLNKFFANPTDKAFCVTFVEHEQKMQYYNAVQRLQYYEHNVRFPGLCHCLDCCNELNLHKSVLIYNGFKSNEITCSKIIKEIETLDAHMPYDSKLLDKKSPHGINPHISPKSLINDTSFQKKQAQYQKFKEERKNKRGNNLVKKAPMELINKTI